MCLLIWLDLFREKICSSSLLMFGYNTIVSSFNTKFTDMKLWMKRWRKEEGRCSRKFWLWRGKWRTMKEVMHIMGCKGSQNTRKSADRNKINVTVTSSNRKTAANKISVVSIFRFMLWISSGLYSILLTNSWTRIKNKSAAS